MHRVHELWRFFIANLRASYFGAFLFSLFLISDTSRSITSGSFSIIYSSYPAFLFRPSRKNAENMGGKQKATRISDGN